MEEKLAISQYELRLAQEDMLRLKAELQKRVECPPEESSGRYLPFFLLSEITYKHVSYF